MCEATSNQNRKPVEAADLRVGQVWASPECNRRITLIDGSDLAYRCSDIPGEVQEAASVEFADLVNEFGWTLAPQSGGVA